MKSSIEESDDTKPTAYERRLWVEIDRILYQNYLTPRTVTDFWIGDRDAIIWHLKQMKERVIRTIVIIQYVELDDVLNRLIVKHLFGKKAFRRGNKRVAGIQAMLDRIYPLQKLDIVKTFQNVPDRISNHVMTLNTLRNSFAHRFDLTKLSKSKRLYKVKYDVFTKGGLDKFKADMWEVDEFFQPEVIKASLELVRIQREKNERRSYQSVPANA